MRAGLRLLRAASVSVVVIGLAGSAHVIGHGSLPHPGRSANGPPGQS